MSIATTTKAARAEGSRWIALLPFGAGQFQNGDLARGIVFALGEGLLAGTLTASYAYSKALESSTPRASQVASFNARLATAATVNRVAFAGLATFAAVGIVDAQVRFTPTRVAVTASADAGGGTVTLRLTF